MRIVLLAALLALAAAVNGAWLSRLPVRMPPDLLLLVVLPAALRYGGEAGALFGAAAGYLRDLTAGTPLGLHVLVYLLVGLGAGALSPLVDVQQRLVPAAAGAVGTLGAWVLGGLVVTAAGLAPVRWGALLTDAAWAAALALVLAGAADRAVAVVDRLTQRRYEGRIIGERSRR